MKQTLAMSLTTATLLSLLGGCSSNDSTPAPTVVVGTAPSIALNPNPPAIVDTTTSTVAPTVDAVEEETTELPEEADEDTEEGTEADESEEGTEVEEGTEAEEDTESEEATDEEEDVDVVSSATINYTSSNQKIIQLEPYFVVADETTGEAYRLINTMDISGYQLGQVCETMYVHVVYGPENTGDENSLITETCAMFLAPTSQEPDVVGAYLAMIESTDFSTYDTVSLDLSQVTNMTAAEQEALWWLLTQSVSGGTEVLLNTKEELTESGAIVDDTFQNGVLLSFKHAEDADGVFQLTYEEWESDALSSINSVMATPDADGVYTLTPTE